MLHGELHGRQRVLNLVGYLPRHFSPGELALSLGQLPATLDVLFLHVVEGWYEASSYVARLAVALALEWPRRRGLEPRALPWQGSRDSVRHEGPSRHLDRQQHQQLSKEALFG